MQRVTGPEVLDSGEIKDKGEYRQNKCTSSDKSRMEVEKSDRPRESGTGERLHREMIMHKIRGQERTISKRIEATD